MDLRPEICRQDWYCLKCKILWIGRIRPKHKAYCDGIVVDATGRRPAPDRVSQTFGPCVPARAD